MMKVGTIWVLMARSTAVLVVLVGLWGAAAEAADAADEGRATALKNKAKLAYWGVGERQDYRRALQLYEQAAALGDVEASYLAGGMYYTGKGAPRNLFKAFTYLDYAASQGQSSTDAQRALAQFYLLGTVVPQNYAKAAEWYETAAAAGDPEAEVELGVLLFAGRGVEQDYERAYELFQRAAYRNNQLAQYNLGIMWFTGNGVPQLDLTKAYAWFSVAAGNGLADAAQARDYVAGTLNESELNRGQAEASRIFIELQRQRLPAAAADEPR
ncbi:tetratricopeptide repeat protein [Desulfofustis limnaeus]|jgi:TPR repeat protein|uniref:Sel1 repeat family protein n=1 Tax=Desulfofustis limnaeus TaxID=2740163 RepID=A0ABN6M743_9BACT|nr:tetratricopeptide repeat protein [Desulfofustis limnaeus]MDX9894791.1 tetratricopeptide repeat protein [Desulfofustis sp.]BDD87149.1 hypothetical protein DPPLL_15140 [Desulfofustis limnaeus]